jgi:hypothetical protein
VALSGIAPAVLGAMVHLAVLVGRPESAQPAAPVEVDEHAGKSVESTHPATATDHAGGLAWTWDATPPPPTASPDDDERVAALIAAGVGRRRLSRELGVTEYEARRLLNRTRPTTATANATSTSAAEAMPSTSSGALS